MTATATKDQQKKENKGAARAEKDKAEVDARHAEIRAKWQTHDRTEIATAITGLPAVDKDGRSKDGSESTLSLRTVGGRLYVEADGEVVLDRDGVIELLRFANSAHQAVA